MKYLIHWYLSETDHKDYPKSAEVTLQELEEMIPKLKNKEQVIYINNVVPGGRLLAWGKDEYAISLELQYTAHCYAKDIKKSEFNEYILKIHEIVKAPEEYGFDYEE